MSGKGRGRGSALKSTDYTHPLRKPGETRVAEDVTNRLGEVSLSDRSQDDESKPGLEKKQLPKESSEEQAKHTGNEPNADVDKNTATEEVTDEKIEPQRTDAEKDIEEKTQTIKETDEQIKTSTSVNTATNVTTPPQLPTTTTTTTTPKTPTTTPPPPTTTPTTTTPPTTTAHVLMAPVTKPHVSPLSSEAPEFVPGRGGKNTTSPRAIASILVNAVNAPVFVPRNQRIIPARLRRRSSKAEDALVNTVKDVILKLTDCPGEFDEQLLVLCHTWSIRPCDEKSLPEIVDLIFEQSVLEPNFRYTGSKLADCLSRHQDSLPGGENFRTVFMKRCKQEHKKREELLSNQETFSRVHGFVLFLGELFCNFKIVCAPALILLKGLLEMLDILAKQCSDDGMDCVGRILKMTGYLIDDDSYVYKDFEATKERIDNLFKQIAATKDSSALKRRTKELLIKVLELRNNNWGQEQSVAPVAYFGNDEPEAAEYLSNYYTVEDTDNPTYEEEWAPVTNPDQWSDYHDDIDFADSTSYYFPQQSYPQEDYDAEDIEREFEQFQEEEEQRYSGQLQNEEVK